MDRKTIRSLSGKRYDGNERRYSSSVPFVNVLVYFYMCVCVCWWTDSRVGSAEKSSVKSSNADQSRMTRRRAESSLREGIKDPHLQVQSHCQ